MIQEKINKLKPYFRGLKVADNYRIVEFNLKNTWVIEKSDDIELQQKKIKESDNVLYSMFYSEKKSFDDILDYVENEVIKYNLDLEEKERLLMMKVEELKRVFENKGLDELNNLKFTTEDNTLKLGSKKPQKPTPPPPPPPRRIKEGREYPKPNPRPTPPPPPPPRDRLIKEGENPNKPEYLNGIDDKNKQNGHTKELSEQS